MKKIGMIVAVEMKAVLDRYGSTLKEKNAAGYKVVEVETEKYQLIIANCGAGEIAAAAGTQYLISEYGVDMVVNFGVVGGLTEEMAKTKTCIVERVVHYEMDTSALDGTKVGQYAQYPDIFIPADQALLKKALEIYPDLKVVTCASGDKFVADPEQKRKLHTDFEADICEMEAAGILMTCIRNQIPCMMLKIVSDGITGGAEEFVETIDEASAMCLEIVTKIIDEV